MSNAQTAHPQAREAVFTYYLWIHPEGELIQNIDGNMDDCEALEQSELVKFFKRELSPFRVTEYLIVLLLLNSIFPIAKKINFKYCSNISLKILFFLIYPMVTLRIPPLLTDFPDIEGGVSLDILICIGFP